MSYEFESRYYKLVDGIAVRCDPSECDWGDGTRHVGYEKVGDTVVSTVFLNIDHNWSNVGEPHLFETMVFGGPYDQTQLRCSTLEEAKIQHASTLRMVTADD